MAKKEQVNTRKLKDEAAEYLKKSKFEKAAEVLETLVGAEPKDMQHRLRLGDTYRRMDQIEKAIGSYQHAAKFFADEGQLIKAIGAVKIILEIDPQNEEAQKQLTNVNERRFGKVSLEQAGLKMAKSAALARAAEEASRDGAIALPPDDEAPLELDDGMPSPPRSGPALPQRGFQPKSGKAIVPPPPLPDEPEEIDLNETAEALEVDAPPAKGTPQRRPPPRAEVMIDLDPDMAPEEEPEELPDDAILMPSAEDLATSPDEAEITPDEEIKPAAAPPPSRPLKPARAKAPEVIISDEIVIEDEAPAAKGPRAAAKRAKHSPASPIADLLSSDAEEEIELFSITSDEEIVERQSGEPAPADEELESAFGKLAQTKKVPIKKVPLFDDLSQQAFVELVNKLGYHRHGPGEVIIREGDPGRSFFIIVEGKVRVYKMADEEEITLAHLGEGAFFGEMALLSGAPRTANVAAEEETEILEVTDTVLRGLAAKYPQVVSSLKNFYRQRLLNNVMAISPLFKDFNPAERKQIVEKFRMKQAGPGEVLITEGENSDGLYVVLHGAVGVATAKDRQPIELARLKEGDIFGEMSLLTRDPATATVTSQGNSILLRLPRENFQELVLTHPQILELVSQLTEKRKSATEAILHGQGEGHDGMSFV